MNRNILLAVAGVALALATSAQAQAQPAGSYRQTCRNIRFQGGLLSAECTGVRGEVHRTTLNAGQCRGDVGNMNGVLACNGAAGMDQGLVAQDRGSDRSSDRGFDRGRDDDRRGYGRGSQDGYGRGGPAYGDGPGYGAPGYGSGPGYGGGLVLFDRPGFGGRSFAVDHDIDNLNDTGFNDRAWSVRVRGGAWRLCADSDYRHCQVIDRDVEDLARIGLGHTISSVQRIR